jgi:CHAT domain-containing protein/tetratricopeptide (TPR) repeat protein
MDHGAAGASVATWRAGSATLREPAIGLFLSALAVLVFSTFASARIATPADSAAALTACVDSLRESGDYPGALGCARQLLALRQEDPNTRRFQMTDASWLLKTMILAVDLPDSQRAALAWADSAGWLMRRLQMRGAQAEAIAAAERQVQIRTRVLGSAHPDVAMSLSILGEMYFDIGQPALAEAPLTKALAIRQEAFGLEHPLVAKSLYNLGCCYEGRKQPAKVESLMNRALTLQEALLKPDDPDLAATLSALAEVFHSQAEYSQAEPLFLRALAIEEKSRGPVHPDLAPMLNGLALLYQHQGRCTEAERLFRRSLEIRENALGPEHLSVATGLNNLALLYQDQGRYAQAESLFRRALAIRARSLPADNPRVASTMNNLALNYLAQGQYSRAEPLFKQTLASRERALGPDHPNVANSLLNLSGLLSSEGLGEEAEALCLRAVAIYEKKLGPDHPDLATALNGIGGVYEDQGQWEKAEPYLRRALAIREKRLGPDHPDVASSLINLGGLCLNLRQYALAESLYEQALAIDERSSNRNQTQVASTLECMAVLQGDRGEFAAAESLERRALALREGSLSPDHPAIVTNLKTLGGMVLAQKEPDRALPLLKEACSRFEAARLRVSRGLQRATFRRSPYPVLAEALLASGQTAQAWPAVEQGSGRALLELLVSARERPLSVAELAREDSLRKRMATLQDQLLTYRSVVGADSTASVASRAEQAGGGLVEAEAAWARFRQQMASKYPVAEGQAFDLTRVQSSLASEDAIVGWLEVKGERGDPVCPTWGYVIRKEGPVWWRQLDGNDASPTGSSSPPDLFRRRVSRRPTTTGSSTEESRAVFAARLAPLMEHLEGISHLVVVPSGDMLGIPVEALPEAKGDGWIADRFAVSYAPSATVYVWLRGRGSETSKRAVSGRSSPCLALGDPPFSPAQRDAMASKSVAPVASGASASALPTAEPEIPTSIPAGSAFLPLFGLKEPDRGGDSLLVRQALHGNREVLGRLARLPASREEASIVASLCGSGSRLLLGPAASEQELDRMAANDELGRFRILHFSTHTLVDDKRPENSALVLSQVDLPDPLAAALSGAPIYTGCVSAADILRDWKLSADLVTLSGCETALGQKVAGEGYVGLAQAFLQAGARSVLVSLWRVEDRSTSLLMQRFYEDLLGGYSGVRGQAPDRRPGAALAKADALQEAKGWLRNWKDTDGRRPYADPFYWAAFVLIGDPI